MFLREFPFWNNQKQKNLIIIHITILIYEDIGLKKKKKEKGEYHFKMFTEDSNLECHDSYYDVLTTRLRLVEWIHVQKLL